MQRYIRLFIFLLILWSMQPRCLNAAGLSTGFSEVSLENLQTGKAYSTKEAVGLPLAVVNTSDEPVDLKIELLLPQKDELKDGFAPIPDLDWISLEQTEFINVLPNTAAVTDVRISIPDDPQYKGKQFAVFLWSHTTGKRIGVGLKSKLLLTISAE